MFCRYNCFRCDVHLRTCAVLKNKVLASAITGIDIVVTNFVPRSVSRFGNKEMEEKTVWLVSLKSNNSRWAKERADNFAKPRSLVKPNFMHAKKVFEGFFAFRESSKAKNSGQQIGKPFPFPHSLTPLVANSLRWCKNRREKRGRNLSICRLKWHWGVKLRPLTCSQFHPVI